MSLTHISRAFRQLKAKENDVRNSQGNNISMFFSFHHSFLVLFFLIFYVFFFFSVCFCFGIKLLLTPHYFIYMPDFISLPQHDFIHNHFSSFQFKYIPRTTFSSALESLIHSFLCMFVKFTIFVQFIFCLTWS